MNRIYRVEPQVGLVMKNKYARKWNFEQLLEEEMSNIDMMFMLWRTNVTSCLIVHIGKAHKTNFEVTLQGTMYNGESYSV